MEFGIEELTEAVGANLSMALGVRMDSSRLPAELESNAHELANSKYGSAAWTKRR
jgi:hypothetical protein